MCAAYDPSGRRIRVLIADDSAFMRKLIREVLSRDPAIEVVATASDGVDAVNKVLELDPDVVVLDVQMPRMNGLEALKEIMKYKPKPVIIFSAFTDRDADLSLQALRLGAVDIIPKPGGPISLDISEVADQLLLKVKTAARSNLYALRQHSSLMLQRHRHFRLRVRRAAEEFPDVAVAIAASTGGPSAVARVLSALPKDLPAAVLIVQHMPAFFTKRFAEHLDKLSELTVKEAENGEKLRMGTVYVAPGDYHMLVVQGVDGAPQIKIHKGPKINNVRPSADPLFQSVARVFGRNAVAVVLTGLGSDGAEGVRYIKRYGGYVIAQDKETSVVFGMPRAAIETGCVDTILPLHQIASEIERVVRVRYLSSKARI
ncbi:MAG: chemotaxis response regulator protein-glutamate methylesterase [Thermoprotei archaeon]|nr:MAG: chemotaxis response regulator protein-glutamate methylesterase [Thermoprotei archaeon]